MTRMINKEQRSCCNYRFIQPFNRWHHNRTWLLTTTRVYKSMNTPQLRKLCWGARPVWWNALGSVWHRIAAVHVVVWKNNSGISYDLFQRRCVTPTAEIGVVVDSRLLPIAIIWDVVMNFTLIHGPQTVFPKYKVRCLQSPRVSIHLIIKMVKKGQSN